MKYLPTDTLAYFKAAPQVQAIDLGHLPVAVFSERTKEYKISCGKATPQQEALTFYALNHSAALVRKTFTDNEPLPAWAQTVMTTYNAELTRQALRSFHYLLLICTQEFRHLHTMDAAWWDKMNTTWWPGASSYLVKVDTSKLLTTAPATTMKAYTGALAMGFRKGKWSGGYGGKAWAAVADVLHAYVTGQYSMEMMVDTSYTLAHNNGPIFNKGMMYDMYDATLVQILDVQRAGQVPELMLDTHDWGVKKTDLAKQMVALVTTALPGEFKGYVDWVAVDLVRPDKKTVPNKYNSQIATQQKLHPDPEAAAKAALAMVAQQAAEQAKKAQEMALKLATDTAKAESLAKDFGGKVTPVGTWTVLPNQEVTVYTRSQS